MTPPPDTDAPDPHGDDLDPDEAAVHAVLDGEATADERRRVARDPRLVARLAELRAVAEAVAAPPPPPPAGTFDRLRATALAALDEPVQDTGAGADAGPDDLGESEAEPADPAPPVEASPDHTGDEAPPPAIPLPRKRTASRRLPPLPAVAAVVLVLLAFGAGLILTDGKGEDDAQTAADQPNAAESGAGSLAEGSAGDDTGGAPETTVDQDLRDQFEDSAEGAAPESEVPPNAAGSATSFPDDDALRSVLEDIDPRTLVAPGTDPATTDDNDARAVDDEVTRCSRVLEASDGDIGAARAALRVTVGGEELLVLSSPVAASEDAPATIWLSVVEPVGCVPRFVVQRDA